MKIIAIVGSPKPNGNTYKTVMDIENKLKEKDSSLEIETIQLCKTNLQLCKGCYLCLSKGEEFCSIKDEREQLDDKLKKADGVIFATPVYTYNVSWTMKNFLDRFAYRCHRPDYHGKKAMIVVTTGAVGLGYVKIILSMMTGAMGFITCASAGLTYAPAHEINHRRIEKEQKKLMKQTDRFFTALMDSKPVKPSLLKLITFRLQQKSFGNSPKDLADYRFWKQKGWLEPGRSYFYPVKINRIKKILAGFLAKLST
jgi:multimeric flavodoxin WrbA